MDNITTFDIKWAEDDCNSTRQAHTRRQLGGLSIDELPEECSFPYFLPPTDGSEPTLGLGSLYVAAFGMWAWVGSKPSAATRYWL